jgi:hypothetical protein
MAAATPSVSAYFAGHPRRVLTLDVPEYAGERALPLVMALHGGNGNGRAFLWSWLRDARAQRALSAAGARVTCREIDDLSHTCPGEVNAEVLAWMTGVAAPARRLQDDSTR